MGIIDWYITFEWQGKMHRWKISYQETIHMPTVFHVYEGKRFAGQLIYYKLNDQWCFFYKNQDNVQELADILSDFVIRAYQ